MGVLKSPGTLSERVFAGHSGGTTTCDHSQELTSGLLELKVTGVFTASVPFTAVSHLRAIPVMVSSKAGNCLCVIFYAALITVFTVSSICDLLLPVQSRRFCATSRPDVGKGCLPLLRFILGHGNVTVFEWRTGKRPARIEAAELDFGSCDDDEDIDTKDAETGEVSGLLF